MKGLTDIATDDNSILIIAYGLIFNNKKTNWNRLEKIFILILFVKSVLKMLITQTISKHYPIYTVKKIKK